MYEVMECVVAANENEKMYGKFNNCGLECLEVLRKDIKYMEE